MCPKGSRTGAKRKRRSRPRVLASEQIVSEQRPGRRATLRGRRSQAPRPARWQQAAPQCPRPDAISASRRPRSRRSTGCRASPTGSPLRRREKVLRATSRPRRNANAGRHHANSPVRMFGETAVSTCIRRPRQRLRWLPESRSTRSARRGRANGAVRAWAPALEETSRSRQTAFQPEGPASLRSHVAAVGLREGAGLRKLGELCRHRVALAPERCRHVPRGRAGVRAHILDDLPP